VSQRNLEFLEGYKHIDEETFLKHFFEMIEACLDIASHVSFARGFERTEKLRRDVRDTRKNGELWDMVRFRNCCSGLAKRMEEFVSRYFVNYNFLP
jgi:hypothetical protein